MRWIAPMSAVLLAVSASAADKPNIILIVSDDFGYGDAGVYGGGNGTRHADAEPRQHGGGRNDFLLLLCAAQLHARPRGDADRSFPESQRHDDRGLPGSGRRIAQSRMDARRPQLKTAGYKTYFTGKWHLGEADYALPNAHGYDVMKCMGIYHLNAYTYGDPTWFPDMPDELRAMFNKVTKGMMSGNAGEPAKEDFKVNGQYVDKPGASITMDGVTYPTGVVGIPYLDAYIEKAALEFLDRCRQDPGQAVLHERQLHEGAPAQHAAPRLRA